MPTLLSIHNYHYRRAGAEAVFLDHNRLFEEMGWQVVPFSMHHPSNLPSPWSRYFAEELEFGHDYGPLGQLLRAAKVVWSWEARAKLEALLREVRPTVVHVHSVYHHLSPAVLGPLRRLGVPVVMTLHDLKLACPAYTMLARDGVCERCKGGHLYEVVRQRCIKGSLPLSMAVFFESGLHRVLDTYRRNVDSFVVPSRFYIEKFKEWGLGDQCFRHLPNFIEPQRFVPQFEPGNEVLYLGRLANEKGVATLVRAAALANVSVGLAGRGPMEPALRRLVEENRAPVRFFGFCAGDALHTVIRNARAVAVPSEWYENAPISVLEAYALGKPVLGARIGGIPELVRENETGWTFESGDVESLAAALRRIADASSDELSRLGRTARTWVEQEFTSTRYTARMLDLYRDLGAAS